MLHALSGAVPIKEGKDQGDQDAENQHEGEEILAQRFLLIAISNVSIITSMFKSPAE